MRKAAFVRLTPEQRAELTERLERAALNDKPRSGAPPKFDGKQEAMIIALACSEAPEGRTCWTAELLANRAVELGVAESISESTVRRILKKTP